MSTEYQRQKLSDWVHTTPSSRLVPGGRQISIATRWHENDLAAIFEEEGWVTLKMPAIDEDGNSTYPKYWTVEALIGDDPSSAKSTLGTKQFELMFQQNVMPEGGNIFKHEYWRYWEQGKAPWQQDSESGSFMPIRGVVQTWDTAFKEKQANDFSVCETWNILDNGYYLQDVWRGKVDFPKLKLVAVSNWEQWHPMAVLIEDAASGQSLIQELKTHTRIPVIAIKVDSSKSARANAVTPTLEAGKVFIPKDAPWRLIWEHEHEVFPGGANDDQVDCCDEATSVLTSGGWKPFPSLNYDDSIATLNTNGELEYQNPTKLINYHYVGPMISIKGSRQIDLLIKPRHKLYVSRSHGANKYGDYELINAELVGHVRFKRDAIWRGRDQDVHIIPGYSGKTNSCRNDFVVDMTAWVEFIGWYLSEGWTSGHSRVGIAQSQGANADKCAIIASCLSKLPFLWRQDPIRGFWTDNVQLQRHLKQITCGQAHQKRIPRDLLELPSSKLKLMLKSMMAGDGWDDRCYATVSSGLADDFLELLLKCELAGTVAIKQQVGKKAPNGIGHFDLSVVCISKNHFNPRVNYSPKRGARTVAVEYDGIVGCCEVPNHVIYVKRHGKPCWIGNCTTQFLNWARQHVVTDTGGLTGVPKKSIWRTG